MQQEDLARLFSAQLSLSQVPAQQTGPAARPVHEKEQVLTAADEQKPAPITYASQHYTHSKHVAPAHQREQEAARSPMDTAELGALFLRNSIDPSLLFPSQVDLFRKADDDQRLRLLELWRISPPQGRQGYPEGVDYNTSRQLYDWPPTSLAQEEAMARLRYESMMRDQGQQDVSRQRYESMMQSDLQRQAIIHHQQELHQSMDDDVSSAAIEAARNLQTTSPERVAEPYIISGYDMLAQREYEESAHAAANVLKHHTVYNHATDPVYNSGLWHQDAARLVMENQYGAFAYARDHDVRPIYVDDEMLM